jgi:hypothetical protein
MYDVIQLRNSSLGNSLLIKRSQWSSVTRDIRSLTTAQFQDAAKELAAGQPIKDPVVRRLLRTITAIGVQVPGSFFQKLRLRGEIRGLLIREGMPAFWLTINPSDLQNPLVLMLAGALYSTDTTTSAVCQIITTSDPVAVARFFHTTCKAILDGLLGSKPDERGILGDISNYFGVVESNGCGMLHLHVLVWARGNLDFLHLRDRTLTDGLFATRMIQYLESVVKQSIHCIDADKPETSISNTAPSATGPESDTEFLQKLSQDANHFASLKQLHSKSHPATCFKYRHQKLGQKYLSLGMSRDLFKTSKVDEHGVIHLARNHPWVNPWNPAIAS